MTNQQVAVRDETAIEPHQPSAQNITAIAQHFVKSGYFQDATDVSKAVVKILAGQEIGIGPFAAMTGINVIKGRITLSANLIAAQIKRSGKYNFHVTEHTDLRCAIDFFEVEVNVGESVFSMDDAKKAGLAGGDNWRNYPRNMLFARAISNGAKWYCPDVFGGSPVYTPDELDAPVDPETGEMLPSANAAPKDNRYWCAEHKTEWFKRGKMKSYAHAPTGPEGSPWCYMKEARLDAKDKQDWTEGDQAQQTPANAPSAVHGETSTYETRLQAFLDKAMTDLGMDVVAVNTIATREGADLNHTTTDLRALWGVLAATAKEKA